MNGNSKRLVRAHIFVSGRVQGVGFRFFTVRVANQFGVTGWVRNLYDGRVEIYAEGEEPNIMGFIESVKIGPPSAHVSNIVHNITPISNRKYSSFSITF